MSSPTEIAHIVQDTDILGGKPHIEGHRIAVHHIAWWYTQGMSAEDLAREFALTFAEVHAALAYYYDHQEFIDHEMVHEAAQHASLAAVDTSPVAMRMPALISERKRQSQSDESAIELLLR